MSDIWIDSRHARIRKYSAAAPAPKAVVRIEIEVDDPGALGYLLREIAESQKRAERERAAAAETAREEKRREKELRALGRQKMLALPDLRGGRS